MVALYCILGLAALFAIANCVYRRSGYFRAINSQYLKFDTASIEAEVANIGSYPSIHCFDWSVDASVKGVNLGVGPEEIYYDNKMFQHYYRRKGNGRMVVVHLITPLVFCENRYTDKLPYNIRYSVVLSQRDVRVSPWLYHLERAFPLARKLAWGCVNRGISIRRKGGQSAINNPSPEQQADAIIAGWLRENPGLTDFINPEQAKHEDRFFLREIQALKELIAFCNREGLIYVPIIGPVSEYIRSRISDGFFNAFVIENLCRAGIPKDSIIDYYSSSLFSGMENYTNGLFLNETARIQFTKMTIAELKRRELL